MIYKLIGNILKNIFIYLGPIYIKIGQIIALDYPILNNLYKLQNKCPKLNEKQVLYYQNKYKNLNIQKECLASGSIAVVHIGNYNNNKIAIKMKRPNIDRSITNSLWYTRFFIKIFLSIPFFSTLNLEKKIETTLELYKKQTDFKNEVNNWLLYKETVKNSTNIIVPYFYEEFCNDEIIVMQFIGGNNIINDNDKLDDNKKKNIGQCILGQFISGLSQYGIIHGDLHCGNFSFINDKVIIYDFGIVLKLSEHEQEGFLQILESLFENDIRNTIQLFFEYFCDLDKDDVLYNSILDNNNLIFKNDLDIFNIFLELKKYLEENKIKFNDKMILIELSILSLNNTMSHLNIGKDINILIEDFKNSIINSILES